MAGGLLTRLGRLPGDAKPAELAALVQHIGTLLNARRGNAPCDPGYGLPDFTEAFHTFPRSVSMMCREITRVIEQYEPRLRNVAVELTRRDAGALVLYFALHAELVSSGQPVQLTTSLWQTGHVTVR